MITTEPTRRQIWAEVALNLVVRALWAGVFVVFGFMVHDMYTSPGFAVIFGFLTALILAAAVIFEYRRAAIRLRRASPPAQQTIGELHDGLPDDRWIYYPAWGVRVKKVAGVSTVTIEGTDCP